MVNETTLAFTLIFDVAVEIAELIDPAQRCFNVWSQFIEETQVTGPYGVTTDEDQPQRRRIDRAIVRCVRNFIQMRHFADAQFVQDFAGFLIAPFVVCVPW